jgi:putative phage-type endonuclease
MNNDFQTLIYNIIENYPHFIVFPNYEELIYKQLILTHPYDKELYINEIPTILKLINKERCVNSYVYSTIDDNIQKQLTHLQNIIQPAQHTPEWYTFRNQHITASNAWKVFGSQSVKNQIIYEKCKIYNDDSNKETKKINLNETTLSWGHKYEPLTKMLYEHFNNTIVQEFGCIEHPVHIFLAASPDGIVVGNNNFGRMIEIKNVVSREINGKPKLEYYIQTQMQMEVCDLNECDFVETKFKEYETYNEFINDTSETKKGIILVYVLNNNYSYHYMPFNIHTEEDINKWLDDNMNHPGEWIKNVYWNLELYSCVLIQRQREWFKYALPFFYDIWNTIVVERLGDYSNRAPKKRISKTNININT